MVQNGDGRSARRRPATAGRIVSGRHPGEEARRIRPPVAAETARARTGTDAARRSAAEQTSVAVQLDDRAGRAPSGSRRRFVAKSRSARPTAECRHGSLARTHATNGNDGSRRGLERAGRRVRSAHCIRRQQLGNAWAEAAESGVQLVCLPRSAAARSAISDQQRLWRAATSSRPRRPLASVSANGATATAAGTVRATILRDWTSSAGRIAARHRQETLAGHCCSSATRTN